MGWNCQTCTYLNINDSAVRCHTCDTVRHGGAGAPPAIVDLTEICSPIPTHSNSNSNATREQARQDGQRDGIMESNRSRRRRRQENSSNEGGAILVNKTSSNSTGDTFFRRQEKVKGDSEDASTTSMNQNNIAPARSGTSQTSKKSNKSGTPGERNEGVNNGSKRKRKGEDENDIIIDPAPRMKLPLDINGRKKEGNKTSFEFGKRKESKLKRRKVDVKMKSQVENDTKKQSVASITDSKRRQHAENRSQSGESLTSNVNDNKNRPVASSADSKRRQRSSNNDERTGKDNRSQPEESRLTEFFNQRKDRPIVVPHESAEDLLKRANIILQQTFNHNSLRPLQETAVKGALQKSSQIVIMATGGGKSVCYQLPALAGGNSNVKDHAANSSVTIVVCPLIALMIDQVNNLHKKGVRTAACLSSSHNQKEKQDILNRLQADQANANLTPIQLLYCTPELIETDRFRAILTKLYKSNRLYMFAIDEAHCLSTWGHDFRPAYRKLTWVRDAFPDVPFMACTGTATAKVVQDIRNILKFDKNVPCLMGTFNRENISYEVRFKDSLNATKPQGAMADVVAVVKKQHEIANKADQPCSGIIYVHKREDCQSLATQISKATGFVCLPYHAGLKDSERSETQRKWTDGSCSVAVATVAFGMGIDLAHVRYVVHWTMAKSLEGFYQESGRGGRDGKPALSILYYSKDDASKFAYLVKMNAERAAKKKGNQNGFASQKVDHSLVELEGMVNYCIKPMCKRKYVLEHFGEKIDANAVCRKTCDYCISPQKVEREIQASECMSAVVNSHRLMHAGRKTQNEVKKYHHNPLADEESLEGDYGSDDFLGRDEGLLGITEEDETVSDPKKAFVKASSVLKKYETKELGQGKMGGFVNFKSRTFDEPSQEDLDAKRNRAVSIPQHLRSGMPDPLAAHKKASVDKAAGLKSSSSQASESERLAAELAELDKQRAAMLAKMGGSRNALSSRSASKFSPPPSLTFKRRR
mmetsp:Transcript_2221/g.4217  ORF Transcript_2221/g.4217 Transcript_2221/m.4217 type:complete len:988 (-) Transcript_2221:221-3184(-)